MTEPEPTAEAASPSTASFLNRHPFTVPGFFAAAIALIGAGDLPIGYYGFLRAVVLGVAVALAVAALSAKRGWWVAAVVVIIVLWAPVSESWFHPGKVGFSILDVALAATFIVAAALIPPIERKPDAEGKLPGFGSWWSIALIAGAVVVLTLIFITGGNSGIPGPND